jgi:2-alkenal reductase
MIGFVAAGTVGFALTFPSETTGLGPTSSPVAAEMKADAVDQAASGEGVEVAVSTPAQSLPLEQPAVPQTPDLGTLFEAVNPGVVAVHAMRTVQFMDAEAGADGSGWVFDGNHIVTNNHVVDGASSLSISFADGSEVAATLVGADDDADLAVLRVAEMPDSARALPLVEDFDSLRVGEPVVAIGNPFGLNNTITGGIISALGRTISSGPGQGGGGTSYSVPQTIQTDAAINPGNSGGPLVNMRGEVVGINAQIRTSGAVAANSGVGFAIPASVAARVIPGLIADGSYQWSFLGVQGADVDLDIAEANNLEDTRGAYIMSVVPGGPSSGKLEGALAGVSGSEIERLTERPAGGDVVVRIDGEEVANFADLLTYIALETRPGDTVRLTVIRDGGLQDVDVTVGVRPD